MKGYIIFISLFAGLSFCSNVTKKNQVDSECKKLNKRAVDSLARYRTQFKKKKSTLESSLRLLNDAIKCDSSLNVARFNKVSVLNELGEFRGAINVLNELIVLKNDSSLLLLKAPIYDKLDRGDSATLTYKMAYKYFVARLNDDPQNANIIYGKIFAQSRINGKESVRSEIEAYLKKYPNDSNLKALLEDVLR